MTININSCSRNDAIIKSFACRTKYLRDSFPHKFFKSIMLLFIRQRKLNFCCTQARPTIIILISHINIFLFTINFCPNL